MAEINTNIDEILYHQRLGDLVYVVIGLGVLGLALVFHKKAGEEPLPVVDLGDKPKRGSKKSR